MCSSRCASCREHRGTHQYDCPVAWSCTSSHGSISAGGALPALPCASTKGLRGEKSVTRRVFVRGRADATARPESSPTGGGKKKNRDKGWTHTHAQIPYLSARTVHPRTHHFSARALPDDTAGVLPRGDREHRRHACGEASGLSQDLAPCREQRASHGHGVRQVRVGFKKKKKKKNTGAERYGQRRAAAAVVS